MKTLMLSILGFSVLALGSCVKEDTAAQLLENAEARILGKWTLERRVSEVYSPIPAIPQPGTAVTTEYTGTVDDSFTFRENSTVAIDTAGSGATQISYELINPNQVWLGLDTWRIDELTNSKLLLVQDRNDGAQNKRFITKIYLKK